MRNLCMAILMSILVSSLAGCALPVVIWDKPGGTQAELAKTRYQCLKEAQQRVSHAERQGYNAVSDSQVTTNEQLFTSCMNASGWFLISKQTEPTPIPTVESKKEVETQSAAKQISTQHKATETKKLEVEESTTITGKNSFMAKTRANLRSGPSTNFKKIGTIEKGDEVAVLAKKGSWYKIKTENGLVAWCSNSLVTTKNK